MTLTHKLPEEAVTEAWQRCSIGSCNRHQMCMYLRHPRCPARAMRAATQPAAMSEGWRCFICNELFTDRKLAEDHFGFSSLHPPACADPLRDDERGMRERAMFYERAWREALKQRDEALAPAAMPEEEVMRRAEMDAMCVRIEADAVSALRYIERHHGRLSGVGWDRVFDAHDELFAKAREYGLANSSTPLPPKPKVDGQ